MFVLGNRLIGPTAEHLAGLAQQIQEAAVPPTAEQAIELSRLETRLSKLGRIDILLLGTALLTMATARYWTFL